MEGNNISVKSMDEEYMENVVLFRDFLVKLNPIPYVIGEVAMKSLLGSSDFLQLTNEEKMSVKKMYKHWCRSNHPDKWNSANQEDKEISLHLMKVYGDAFLKCNDEENESVWTFMGYTTITFNGFDIHNITLNDVNRLLRDMHVISDIVDQCTKINAHNDEIVEKMREILIFMKLYLNSKDNKVCTAHSFISNLVLEQNCPQCVKDKEDSVDNQSDADVIIDAFKSGDEEDGVIEEWSENEFSSSDMRDQLKSISLKDLIAIARSKDIDTKYILEKSELIEIIIKNNLYDEEATKIKNHKKRANPKKRRVSHETWRFCSRLEVNQLPFDIDGLKCYVLPFDPDNRMKSTLDGRSWDWKSSSRKGFDGMRRVANCEGGFECLNSNCIFKVAFGKNNVYHFIRVVDDDGEVKMICKSCRKTAVELKCECRKIWEFDDDTCKVTVYHHGNHRCTPKPLTSLHEEKLKEKFRGSKSMTPMQAGNEILLDALDDPAVSIEDMYDLVDGVIDQQKVRNYKKKIINDNQPYGNSFEAVGILKSRMANIDRFYIYKLNDRNMNGSISFVFKTSTPLLKLALSLDKDAGGYLSKEYVYFDGTFKRVPGYCTLAAHVYVEVIQMIVRLFSMETESESTDCVQECWNLFNQALQEISGKQDYVFNPHGWVMDEGAGMWSGLEEVYGESATKRSVSCEWHFKQAYEKQAKKLPVDGARFERYASMLLSVETRDEYEHVLTKIETFIEEKKEERCHLYNWLAWWDQRRSHFAKAFKSESAPATNLSENFNSKYVNTNEIKLKLIDAAKSDICHAMKFDRVLKKFGDGLSCAGSGPSSGERIGRDMRAQKKRARDCELSDIEETEEELYISKKRRKEWTDKAKKQGKTEKRPEKYRPKRSREFLKSLAKAKSNQHKYSLIKIQKVSNELQIFSVKFYNDVSEVSICARVSCTCKYFTRPNKNTRETCAHIVWVLLYYFKLPENDTLLNQVGLLSKEIRFLFDGISPDTSLLRPTVLNSNGSGTSDNLTPIEELAIFEAKGEKTNKTWTLNKMNVRKHVVCRTCKSTMPAGKIFVRTRGLYIPPAQMFAVEQNFYFCASFSCLKNVARSNISVPTPETIFQVEAGLTEEDMYILTSRGFKVQT